MHCGPSCGGGGGGMVGGGGGGMGGGASGGMGGAGGGMGGSGGGMGGGGWSPFIAVPRAKCPAHRGKSDRGFLWSLAPCGNSR
jgi:hypothetical protein